MTHPNVVSFRGLRLLSVRAQLEQFPIELVFEFESSGANPVFAITRSDNPEDTVHFRTIYGMFSQLGVMCEQPADEPTQPTV